MSASYVASYSHQCYCFSLGIRAAPLKSSHWNHAAVLGVYVKNHDSVVGPKIVLGWGTSVSQEYLSFKNNAFLQVKTQENKEMIVTFYPSNPSLDVVKTRRYRDEWTCPRSLCTSRVKSNVCAIRTSEAIAVALTTEWCCRIHARVYNNSRECKST